MLEKTIGATGKGGIVGITVLEAMREWIPTIDPGNYQFIAAIGVVTLVFERFVRMYWSWCDRRAKAKKELEEKARQEKEFKI